MRVEPQKPGEDFVFENKITGGVIPREFIPAVEKGVVEAMEGGVLAGYNMVDMKVTLFDGSFHDVDSSEIAFKIAGSMGLKDAVKKAGLVLLEPIMKVEVVVPEDYLGAITGDLNSRRGKIMKTEKQHGTMTLDAEVPLAEMFGYATDLRSQSQGRAVFTMEFCHYNATPKNITEQVVAKAQGQAAC